MGFFWVLAGAILGHCHAWGLLCTGLGPLDAAGHPVPLHRLALHRGFCHRLCEY